MFNLIAQEVPIAEIPCVDPIIKSLSNEETFRSEEKIQGLIRDLTLHLCSFDRRSSLSPYMPVDMNCALQSIKQIAKSTGLNLIERREKDQNGREKFDTYPAILLTNSIQTGGEFKSTGLISCDDLLIAHLDTADTSMSVGPLSSLKKSNHEVISGGAVIDMTSQLATAITFACSLKFSDYNGDFSVLIPTDEEKHLTHTGHLFRISSKIKNVKDLEPTGDHNGYFVNNSLATISFGIKPSTRILNKSHDFCKQVEDDLIKLSTVKGKRIHISRTPYNYLKVYIEQSTETPEEIEKASKIAREVELYLMYHYRKDISLILDGEGNFTAGVNPQMQSQIDEEEKAKLTGALEKVYDTPKKFKTQKRTLPTKIYPTQDGRAADIGPNFISTAMLSKDENNQPAKNWSVVSYSEIHAGPHGRHNRESLDTRQPLNLFRVLQNSIIPEYINQLEL